MSKTVTLNKMKIHELHKLVHQGQDNNIPVIKTLEKYGVSNRAYYTRCKNNNLPTWRDKNKEIVTTNNKNKPNKNLFGGSLQIVPKGGNLALPKKSIDKINEGIASNQRRIKAAEKKSRELDIRKSNGRS